MTILDAVPLWGLFLAFIFFILLAVEGGYRGGQYRRRRLQAEKDAPLGTMVAATLGLLAFMLALTFGWAANRYDTRRGLVVEEANAIGTAYLRAGMLPDRGGDAIRALLREYVDVRLDAVRSGNIMEGVQRSEALQNQLWALATAVAQKNPGSIIVGVFVQSLNDVIDLHAKRVATGRNRIPGVIWFALFLVAALALAVLGYHAALSDTQRSQAIVPVAITFAAVMVLIADLDRPREGFLRVSQQALVDVRQTMR